MLKRESEAALDEPLASSGLIMLTSQKFARLISTVGLSSALPIFKRPADLIRAVYKIVFQYYMLQVCHSHTRLLKDCVTHRWNSHIVGTPGPVFGAQSDPPTWSS